MLFALAIALVLGGAPRLATASEVETLELVYRAPAECPGSSTPSSLRRHRHRSRRYGSCSYHCAESAGDCNGDPADGCEVNLGSDQHNCGSCGHECDIFAGQPRIAGKCAVVACGDGGTPQ